MQVISKGIRVNAVAPGPVYTPLQPASRSGEQMDGWGVGDIPLVRSWLNHIRRRLKLTCDQL